MIAGLIENEREALVDLCRKHHFERLEVFGSAADGTFDSGRSDVDFLVVYFPLAPGEHYEAYFGLWEELQALFDRKVDLVEPQGMGNPYFIRAVNESRKLLHDAESVFPSGCMRF